MATTTIDLDFIPKDLNNAPIDNITVAQRLGKLLLNSKNLTKVYERYQMGMCLVTTGKAIFPNSETQEVKDAIQFFTEELYTYMDDPFTNYYKGLIIDKLNKAVIS